MLLGFATSRAGKVVGVVLLVSALLAVPVIGMKRADSLGYARGVAERDAWWQAHLQEATDKWRIEREKAYQEVEAERRKAVERAVKAAKEADKSYDEFAVAYEASKSAEGPCKKWSETIVACGLPK